jgi:hypothetical protein
VPATCPQELAQLVASIADPELRACLEAGGAAGMLHLVHTHQSKLQDDDLEQLTEQDKAAAARWGGCGGCERGEGGLQQSVCVGGGGRGGSCSAADRAGTGGC